MLATTGRLTLSTLLAILVGLTLAHQADATPFRPRPYNESLRLQAKDDCRAGGGTSFETVYHYEYGGSTPTSVTTTCHGGKNGGQTCEIGGGYGSVQCSKRLLPADERFGAPTDGAVIEQLDANPTPSTTNPAGGSAGTVEPGTVVGTVHTVFGDAEDEDQR